MALRICRGFEPLLGGRFGGLSCGGRDSLGAIDDEEIYGSRKRSTMGSIRAFTFTYGIFTFTPRTYRKVFFIFRKVQAPVDPTTSHLCPPCLRERGCGAKNIALP